MKTIQASCNSPKTYFFYTNLKNKSTEILETQSLIIKNNPLKYRAITEILYTEIINKTKQVKLNNKKVK